MPDELFNLIQTKRTKPPFYNNNNINKENPINFSFFFFKGFPRNINYIFTKFPGHVISKFYLFKLFFFPFHFLSFSM